jgi:hypothetical protein
LLRYLEMLIHHGHAHKSEISDDCCKKLSVLRLRQSINSFLYLRATISWVAVFLISRMLSDYVEFFSLKCFHLESEHHVSALINCQNLNTVLSNAELQPENLMTCDDSSILNINVSLVCLHRKHQLRAVNEFLNSLISDELLISTWTVLFSQIERLLWWTDSSWQILMLSWKQSSERNIWILEIFWWWYLLKPTFSSTA